MNSLSAGERMVASVSLDLDNLWSYLKTYGDKSWTLLPTFIPTVVPRLLDVFETAGITGTIFVVGQDTEVDENCEPLAAIAAAGHEIGNHSYSHEPWLHRYSRERIEEELARTEAGLVRITGRRPIGFRGPGYSLSATLLELLEERGYEYDASTLPTWIGPLARRYYFRTAGLTEDEREERSRLFGRARDGLRPIHPYRWRGAGGSLVELPVTTMPLTRLPIHFSYVLYIHGKSPAAAKAYFRTALRACALRGVGPALLLHPLDLLDEGDAKGAGFFPGMDLKAADKRTVVDWCLGELTSRFDVGGSAVHARAVGATTLRKRPVPRD